MNNKYENNLFVGWVATDRIVVDKGARVCRGGAVQVKNDSVRIPGLRKFYNALRNVWNKIIVFLSRWNYTGNRLSTRYRGVQPKAGWVKCVMQCFEVVGDGV